MLLNLLLVIEVIVAFFLVVVVLLQRSEGRPGQRRDSSLVSVRGAGDLLTRITWILGCTFFVLGLLLTIVAGRERGAASVVDRMKVNAGRPRRPDPRTAPAAGRHSPGARPRRAARPPPLQAPDADASSSPFGPRRARRRRLAPAAPASPRNRRRSRRSLWIDADPAPGNHARVTRQSERPWPGTSPSPAAWSPPWEKVLSSAALGAAPSGARATRSAFVSSTRYLNVKIRAR